MFDIFNFKHSFMIFFKCTSIIYFFVLIVFKEEKIRAAEHKGNINYFFLNKYEDG